MSGTPPTEATPAPATTETPAEAPKPAEPAVVPEKYEFKAPDGFEVDTKLIEAATPILKELGLTQEQGQKLYDMVAARDAASANAAMAQYEATRAEWRGEVSKNPALGDGKDNLKPEVRANISKVFDSAGDAKAVAALKEALDLTGAGDHPAVVAAFNSLGKLLSEGSLVRGGAPSPTGQSAPGRAISPAQAMYPGLPSSASS